MDNLYGTKLLVELMNDYTAIDVSKFIALQSGVQQTSEFQSNLFWTQLGCDGWSLGSDLNAKAKMHRLLADCYKKLNVLKGRLSERMKLAESIQKTLNLQQTSQQEKQILENRYQNSDEIDLVGVGAKRKGRDSDVSEFMEFWEAYNKKKKTTTTNIQTSTITTLNTLNDLNNLNHIAKANNILTTNIISNNENKQQPINNNNNQAGSETENEGNNNENNNNGNNNNENNHNENNNNENNNENSNNENSNNDFGNNDENDIWEGIIEREEISTHSPDYTRPILDS